MKITTHKFKKNLHKHLSNNKVRSNIQKATYMTLDKRAKAVKEFPQWEKMRDKAHNIKKEIVDDLENNIDRFISNAEKNGIKVERAASAAQANKIIHRIIAGHGGVMAVKSKSMVTEEIGMNDYLASHGIEVWETDLGEFIIQLAGEAPSHLIGPAIHMSKEQIAELFSKKLNCENNPDPECLTWISRIFLREKFLKADIGITGANFGVINEGSVVLVENEGNARLSYSTPKVHIIVMGMERLIPSFKDLPLFMTLLGVSASGVKMTGYVSVVNGPKKENELDGPEHVYLILVDNNRRKLLRDPKLKEALYCIRCSACYNTCPIYRNIGGHAYGWVYQGPIGAVITPHFIGFKKGKDLPFASTLCGSCTSLCPVKVPLHKLLLENRHQIVKKKFPLGIEPIAFKISTLFLTVTSLYENSAKFARKLLKIYKKEPYVPGWSISRKFPSFAGRSFREWWRRSEKK